MLKKLNKKAFTLIELLVVIAVVGILVLLGMPRFIGYNKDAEVTAMQQDIKVLSDAALQAHVQTGDWPVNEVSQPLTIDGEEIEGLKSLDEGKFKQYVKSIRNNYDEYALVTSAGEHEGKVYFIGNGGNGLIDRHGKPHYGLEKGVVKIETGEAVNDNLPGSPTPIANNGDVKFFGEVPASEFITGDELASLLNFGAGTSQYSNEPWLKFEIDGKIIYRPRKTIRRSITWDQLDDAGLVFPEDNMIVGPEKTSTNTITIQGTKFKVRLMKGLHDNNPTGHDGDSNHGSEWNRLMLPIHEQAIDGSWDYEDNVEDNIKPLEHELGTGKNGMYNDADLVTHHDHGNGSYSWMQEKSPVLPNSGVLRGYNGVSNSYRNASDTTYSYRGWAPVLEVVE